MRDSRAWALIAVLLLASGCREDRCRGKQPAFQLDLLLAPGLTAPAGAKLELEVGAAGLRRSFSFDAEQALADGRTSVVVEVGRSGTGGFTAEVRASLQAASGPITAEAARSFSASGDACNFFELVLGRARDAAVERSADGGPREAGLDLRRDLRSGERTLDLPRLDLPHADTWPPCKHPPVASSCAGEWCTIPAGCFLMGSPLGEPCRQSGSAETQHPVTLTHGFQIMNREVTEKEFQDRLGYAPWSGDACGPGCPARWIAWHDAAAYCNALSSPLDRCYDVILGKSCSTSNDCTTNLEVCSAGACTRVLEKAAFDGAAIYSCAGYRLPTEAEWEYAYRAGTTSAFYNGPVLDTGCLGADPNAEAIGWYSKNAQGKVHLPQQKAANAWGLHDLAGNLEEWVHDPKQSDLGSAPAIDPVSPGQAATWKGSRILRGGDWYWQHRTMRAAARASSSVDGRTDRNGFRCARTLP